MTQVDPLQIGGAGLIGVLPPAYFVALALSLAGFVASLSLRRLVPALLTWQLLVTVVVLDGADPIIHGLPRLEASFRHLGIADNIAQSGQLDPTLDAYFNWPGFFNLLGMLSGATGAKDLFGIATWAPVGINILLLAPLLALARQVDGKSAPRLGGCLDLLSGQLDWTGLSGATGLFVRPPAHPGCLPAQRLWRVGLAHGAHPVLPVACPHCQQARQGSVPGMASVEPPRADTAVLVVVCGLILLAMTASHQLSPFAVIPILAAMLLTGRLRLRFLPVLAVVLPVGWLLFAASTFLQGHFGQLFGSLGDIGANSFGALSTRVSGSDAHSVRCLYPHRRGRAGLDARRRRRHGGLPAEGTVARGRGRVRWRRCC